MMPPQEIIYSIFLPIVFFYLVFYALLRKAKLFGDSKVLDASISLVLSCIVVLSLYMLKIVQYTIGMVVIVFLAGFVTIFLLRSVKKYQSVIQPKKTTKV